MKKFILLIILLLLICILTTTLGTLNEQNMQDRAIEQLTKQKSDIKNQTELPLMNFASLQSKNPDIIAWITINDTDIDYPITQAKDNDYYLHYDAEKNKNKNGSIFLDYRNNPDFNDNNNIVYGHNMKNGKMFADINLFKDENYFNSHATGHIYTPQKTYCFEIFEVAVVPSVGDAYTWVFDSEASWNFYIAQIQKDAMFLREINLSWRDRIITLSTCSYEFKNARTVILAKIIN